MGVRGWWLWFALASGCFPGGQEGEELRGGDAPSADGGTTSNGGDDDDDDDHTGDTGEE
jgi:hypothetical protein